LRLRVTLITMACGVLAASPAGAQEELRLTLLDASTPLGASLGPFRVQRLSGGAPFTVGNTVVTLTSSSDGGWFSTTAVSVPAPWSTALAVDIADGASESGELFYWDNSPGASTLTASASSATPATAQVRVTRMLGAVDFEAPSLVASDQPPGPFNMRYFSTGEISADLSSEALRGAQALHVQDDGGGFQNQLELTKPPGLRRDFYMRQWTRLIAVSDGGFLRFFGVNGNTKQFVNLDAYADRIVAAAGQGGSPADVRVTVPLPSLGEWHLYEASLSGLGSNDGGIALTIDGAPAATWSNLAWASSTFDVRGLLSGLMWSNSSTRGALFHDDYAVSLDPMIARLSLSSDAGFREGDCTAVDVIGQSSFGGAPALSPFDVELALELREGSATLHADATCAAAKASVRLPAGAASTRAFVKPLGPGPLELALGSPTFLATAPLRASVSPSLDVPPPAPGRYEAGCACRPGGAAPLVVLGLLGWRRLRSRRRPP
jgi:hypothetical protein